MNVLLALEEADAEDSREEASGLPTLHAWSKLSFREYDELPDPWVRLARHVTVQSCMDQG